MLGRQRGYPRLSANPPYVCTNVQSDCAQISSNNLHSHPYFCPLVIYPHMTVQHAPRFHEQPICQGEQRFARKDKSLLSPLCAGKLCFFAVLCCAMHNLYKAHNIVRRHCQRPSTSPPYRVSSKCRTSITIITRAEQAPRPPALSFSPTTTSTTTGRRICWTISESE